MQMHEGNQNSLKPLTSTPKDIHAACAELCKRFGFDQFLYLSKYTGLTPHRLNIINGHSQLKEAASSKGVLRITHSPNGYQDIEELLKHVPIETKKDVASLLLETSPHHSFISTLSFPVKFDDNHFGILVVTSSIQGQAKISDTQLFQARELAAGIHKTAIAMTNKNEVAPAIKLTNREQECLQWAANGKTNWEIGKILGISERTVRFHLVNTADKLNTSNRIHTVAQAIALGLVEASWGFGSLHMSRKIR